METVVPRNDEANMAKSPLHDRPGVGVELPWYLVVERIVGGVASQKSFV